MWTLFHWIIYDWNLLFDKCFKLYRTNMHLPGKIIPRLLLFGIVAVSAPASFAQQTPAGDTSGKMPRQVKSLVATGIVKDAASGKPLAAINIFVPGFSATHTDDNGNF